MKCKIEKSLIERVKILSDNGMSHKCLHWSIAQHIAMVLLVLGLGTSTTLAQIRAYVANTGGSFTASGTVVVIDTATNTAVATIPVGPIPFAPIGIAITPDGTRSLRDQCWRPL
jgi:YVTN family beta-propeller protein